MPDHSILHLIAGGAAAAGALMLILWLIHLPMRNAAIVDFGWAAGLVLIAWVYVLMGEGRGPRQYLMVTMVSIWGLRLAFYLLLTRVLGHPEEGRYVELRRRWKTNLPLKFFLFFEFQALLCVALSIPFLASAQDLAPRMSLLEYGAGGLWLAAMTGEALADWQLSRFKSDPANRGTTCRRGLWRFSRHPNYFFEWLIWVSFALLATASPFGYLGWISPALILFFLFRVTGIPATEDQAVRSRGDDYRRYQQTTSAFVPWFPKS